MNCSLRCCCRLTKCLSGEEPCVSTATTAYSIYIHFRYFRYTLLSLRFYDCQLRRATHIFSFREKLQKVMSETNVCRLHSIHIVCVHVAQNNKINLTNAARRRRERRREKICCAEADDPRSDVSKKVQITFFELIKLLMDATRTQWESK